MHNSHKYCLQNARNMSTMRRGENFITHKLASLISEPMSGIHAFHSPSGRGYLCVKNSGGLPLLHHGQPCVHPFPTSFPVSLLRSFSQGLVKFLVNLPRVLRLRGAAKPFRIPFYGLSVYISPMRALVRCLTFDAPSSPCPIACTGAMSPGR